jgi:hypothetical protein
MNDNLRDCKNWMRAGVAALSLLNCEVPVFHATLTAPPGDSWVNEPSSVRLAELSQAKPSLQEQTTRQSVAVTQGLT